MSAHPHGRCESTEHLRRELARVEALGGEGLMLRKPGSRYEHGRSSTLLKVKSFKDDEARVIRHVAGMGRHKGRLGALEVELRDGTRFSVGTGFSDAERESPPAVGEVITFRYQELSDDGVPRFPSYLGARVDVAFVPASVAPVAVKVVPPPAPRAAPTGTARRFELVEGSAAKFWEVEVRGASHVVRYGRLGSNGQEKEKAFASEEAAAADAEKLVREKTAKGYAEAESS